MGVLKSTFNTTGKKENQAAIKEIKSPEFAEKIEKVLHKWGYNGDLPCDGVTIPPAAADALTKGTIALIKKSIPVTVNNDMRDLQQLLDAKADLLKLTHQNLDSIQVRSAHQVDVVIREYARVHTPIKRPTM